MLCGADSGLYALHVPPQPPQAIPGRTSCHCYPRLWESWCCCPARGHLWWLKGWWHTVSLCASPIPFSFAVVLVVLYHLDLLTLSVVPNFQTNNLCPALLWPPLAPSVHPAVAPQCEFWLLVVVRHALTSTVPRNLSKPWLFCWRAPLTLSASLTPTNLTVATSISNSVSSGALRRCGWRPCRTAKGDLRRRVRIRYQYNYLFPSLKLVPRCHVTCSLPRRSFVVYVVCVIALVIRCTIRSGGACIYTLLPQPCCMAPRMPALDFLGFLAWNLCTFAFVLWVKCAGSHVLSQAWSVSFHLT